MRKQTDRLSAAVLSALKRCGAEGKQLCAAVSGGMDSSVLLHCLLQLVPKEQIMVLHVEHGIRGAQSKADAAFVKETCQRLGVRAVEICVDAPSYAKMNGVSIESAARSCRLNAYDEIILRGQADYILTAHHQNDQSETILLHMLRGSGLRGLKGMREKSGYTLRPMLLLSRAEIERYAAKNDIRYVVDETNASDAHDRNFLRNRVLPLLRSRWDVDGSLQTLSLCASDAVTFMDEAAEDGVTFAGDSAKISVNKLRCGEAAASAYVFRALEGIHALNNIERKHIEAVIRLAGAQNGKRIMLKNGLCAAKEYEVVTLYRAGGREREEIPFSAGVTGFMDGTLIVRGAENRIEKGTLRFDGDRIPMDAVVRTRREGDVFCPFGGGTKKLKQYLIDKKIPLRLRDTLPLVAAGNEILVIAGVEIADSVKLTKSSGHVLEIEYIEA